MRYGVADVLTLTVGPGEWSRLKFGHELDWIRHAVFDGRLDVPRAIGIDKKFERNGSDCLIVCAGRRRENGLEDGRILTPLRVWPSLVDGGLQGRKRGQVDLDARAQVAVCGVGIDYSLGGLKDL